MPTDQNELAVSNLPPDARRGWTETDSPERRSPEKWLAVLAPILLTVAALALFAR